MKLSKMQTPFFQTSLISLSLASAMAVSAFSASAEGSDAVLNSNPTVQLGFYGATWNPTSLNPSAVDPDDDGSNIGNYAYLVKGKTLKCKESEVIKAKSLTIGEVGGTAGTFVHYYTLTILNEGLVLANGSILQQNPNHLAINADVTVTAPKDVPFVIKDNSRSDKSRTGGVHFTKSFSGAEGTGVKVGLTAGSLYNVDLKLSGETSAYLGEITVDGTVLGGEETTPGFVLSGTDFGGSVTYIGKARFEVGGDVPSSMKALTLSAETIVKLSQPLSVNQLTLPAGMVLNVGAQKITVIESFVITGEGKIGINFSGAPSKLPVSEEVAIPLITYPIDCAIGLDDFVVPDNTLDGKTVAFRIVEDPVAGTKTLTAFYWPLITMIERQSDGAGNFTVAGHLTDNSMSLTTTWSDGRVLHDKAYYSFKKISGTTAFVTPFNLTDRVEFPGAGLTFGDTTVLTLQSSEFFVPEIRIASAVKVYGLYSPATEHTLLFDRLFIGNSCSLTTSMRAGSSLILKGSIAGGETTSITFSGAAGSTSSCETINMLDGDNSGYKGKIAVETAANRGTETRGYTTLRVRDGKSFGGARNAFTYDAFSINNMSVLDVLADVTLDEVSRGIYADSSAKLTDPDAKANCVRFKVADAAHALTIRETITLNGTIRKTGAGALALGGALKFLDGEGALTDDVPADAALHTLYVTGGRLKAIAARSLDGLDIVFSNDVSKLDVGLTVDAAATDAELAQYGFINLKTTENPLVASVKTGIVPVTFENLPADPKEAFSVPICTVRKSAAADVLSLLVPAEKRIMLGNVKAKITLSASEPFTLDGFEAVTIKADVTPPAGMLLLVR